MKTMSVKTIQKRAKEILGIVPYYVSEEHVSFDLPTSFSLRSCKLSACRFPLYTITPLLFKNSAFLRLRVYTKSE